MPRILLQEKLARLATDLVSQLLREGMITSASAALVRLQSATLLRVIKVEVPSPSDLIIIADLTDKLLEFLSPNAEGMYAIQRELFEQIQAENSGMARSRSPVPVRGRTAIDLFRSAM